MGFSQFLTQGSIPFTTMGALNTVPSRMERMVPLGLFHISFSLYSSIRAALGVMVALYGNAVFLYGFGGIYGNLIVGFYSGVPVPDRNILFSDPQKEESAPSLIICHRILVISSPSISTGVFISDFIHILILLFRLLAVRRLSFFISLYITRSLPCSGRPCGYGHWPALFRQIGIPLSDRLHNLAVLRIGLYAPGIVRERLSPDT